MTFSAANATVDRARPLARVLGYVSLVGGPLLAVVAWSLAARMPLQRPPSSAPGFYAPLLIQLCCPFVAFISVLLGVAIITMSRSFARRTHGLLEVDARGVSIGGTLVAATSKTARPVECQIDAFGRVWLEGNYQLGITLPARGDVPGLVAALRTTLRARPFMRALSLDKTRREGLVPLVLFASWIVACGGGCAIAAANHQPAVAGGVLGLFAGAPVALLALAAVSIAARVKVTVGADGIELRRLARRPRVVSFAEVERVDTAEGTIVLSLRSGERIPIAFIMEGRNASVLRLAETAAILIRHAAAAYANARSTGENSHALLARNGRTVDEWIRAVRAAREALATFRNLTVQDTDLWAITEDPSLPDTVRVGAALALRESLDEPSRARLRVAAEACVAPRLRVALEAVANPSETEGELEESVAVLDDAPPAKAVAR